jgi:Zn-dependent peptidase ImmA (M78 family)
MRTPPALVTPAVLRWARETAGISLAELAAGLDQSVERIQSWEDGGEQPSMAQLRDIAGRLKRPTATFFLQEPPNAKGRRPVDFRSLPAQELSPVSAALSLEIRLAKLKRDDALGLSEDLEIVPKEFPLQITQREDPEAVGRRIRELAQVPVPGHAAWRDKYSALKAWRDAVERMGVLVMQVSGILTSEMRGCAIAEFPLPVVLINSSDAPAGRIFTLLHELAHLGLRQDGLCDLVEGQPFRSPAIERLEAFCNHVAGAALVPLDSLINSTFVNENRRISNDGSWTDSSLESLSRHYGTSTEVILRRLVIAEEASAEFYSWWRGQQQRIFETTGEDGGFVEYFRRVINHNGRVFTRLVVDAYQKEIITGNELSRMLGTKLSHLPKIEMEISRPELAA